MAAEQQKFGSGPMLKPFFHGDHNRCHAIFLYKPNQSLPNVWDTYDVGAYCTNHVNLDGHVHICKGHTDHAARNGAGMLVDGFHGDPKRHHAFFKYAVGAKLPHTRWDCYHPPTFCTNYRHIEGNLYICLGHK